jgi:hypothetical protein
MFGYLMHREIGIGHHGVKFLNVNMQKLKQHNPEESRRSHHQKCKWIKCLLLSIIMPSIFSHFSESHKMLNLLLSKTDNKR